MSDLGSDHFGVAILPTDTVRIMAYGGEVRLSDTGDTGTVTRRKRTGNLVVKLGDREVTASPGMVGVVRRDGRNGYEGNVGTRYDSHAGTS